MRIAFLTSLMQTGGVETNLVGLARELSARNHDVLVVSSGGDLVGELERAGARHLRMQLRLRNPFAIARAAATLPALLAHQRIAVVHSMSAAGMLALALVPRGGRCRVIASPMGLQNSDHELGIVTDLRVRLQVLRAERVLVISEEIERALRRIGVRSETLVRQDVVGIDAAAFHPRAGDRAQVREELGVPVDALVVTTIGALHSRKSHDLFLRACREVANANERARFVVVGEGPKRAELERLAQELGIANRVSFAGRRRDVPALLAATDVYVKPGIVEGFIGITVLEAMAAGVPVVAFDTRDVRAAVVPEETGLIVPSQDAGALAAAINRLLRDASLGRRLATRARAMVVARFDQRAVAIGLEDLYTELTS